MIDFGATAQIPPVTVTASNIITGDQLQQAIQAVNARYVYSRRILFSEFRDSTQLTGPQAPWYCRSVAEEPEWHHRVVRLPFRAPSPLPLYFRDTWTGTGQLPLLGVYVTGQNIQFFARLTKITWDETTGVMTAGADLPAFTQYVSDSTLNTLSFISTTVDLLFPTDAESGDWFVLDFYFRGNNDNSEDPGYLRDLVIFDPGPSDFPEGSY